MLFAYSDETSFQNFDLNSNEIHGVGILLTDAKVSNNVVDEAMDNLSSDPDKNQIDIKTLERGYFHASEDSKNAHSHFCRAINKYIVGQMNYQYSIKANDNKATIDVQRENAYKAMFGLSSIPIFDYAREITLLVEGRSKFNLKDAEYLMKNWSERVINSTYNQPSFITFFPNINVKISNKKNPGLQVIDFLLWSTNRTKMNPPDNTWFDRINKTTYSFIKDEENTLYGGDIILKREPKFKTLNNYPAKAKDPEGQDLYSCFLLIESIIHQLAIQSIPPHIKYLEIELLNLSSSLANTNIPVTTKTLDSLCTLFIKLFDTMPIYHDLDTNSIEEWELALSAKKMAGLILRKDLAHSFRTSSAILRWRNSEEMKRYNWHVNLNN